MRGLWARRRPGALHPGPPRSEQDGERAPAMTSLLAKDAYLQGLAKKICSQPSTEPQKRKSGKSAARGAGAERASEKGTPSTPAALASPLRCTAPEPSSGGVEPQPREAGLRSTRGRYRERRSGPRHCPGPLGAPVSGSEGAQPCAPPGRKLGWGLEEVTLWNRLGQLSTLSGKTGVSVDEKKDLLSPLLWGEGRKKMVPANGSVRGRGDRPPS